MAASDQVGAVKRSVLRKRNLKLLASVAAVPLIGLCSRTANAANAYWDINGTTAGAGSSTPSGIWDLTTSNWNSDPLGGGAGAVSAWNNAGTDTAVFSAGTNATGIFNVTVAGAISLAGLTLEDGTNTNMSLVAGGGSLSFTTLTLLGTPSGANANIGIGVPLTGTLINSTGPSQLNISVSESTYTGKWSITTQAVTVATEDGFGADPGVVTADEITLNSGTIHTTGNISFSANRGITIGSGFASFAGGTLVTWNGPISGSGNVNVALTGAGKGLVLTNTNNSFTGDVNLQPGNLILGASGVITDSATVTFASGSTFDLNGQSEVVKSIQGSSTSAMLVGSGAVLTINHPTGQSYSGVISGAGKIIKKGTGAIAINGSNGGFTGEIDVNAGAVGVNNNPALGTGSTVVWSDGTTLGAFNSTNRSLSVGTNDIKGNLTIDDTFTATPGQITLNNTITLDRVSPFPTITVNTAAGGSTLTGSYTAVFAGIIGGSGVGLIKDGNGYLSITSANNTYTGDTTINPGSGTFPGGIYLDSDANLGVGGTIHLNGGTLNSTANRGTVTLSNPVSLDASSAITTTSTATGTVNFDLSGPFSGSTGTLTIRNDGGTGALMVRFSGGGYNFTQPIALAAGTAGGTTIMEGFNQAPSVQTFSGLISGPGSFLRSVTTTGSPQGGDTILSGANTFQGGTTLTAGGIGLGIDTVGPADAVTSGPIGTGILTATGGNGHIFASGGSRTLGNTIHLNDNMGVTGSNDVTLTGTISVTGTFAGSLNMGMTGATLSLNNPNNTAFASVGGTGTLSKDNTNTVTVNYARPDAIVLHGGTLAINPSTSGGQTSVTSSISATSGNMDLSDNKLVVHAGNVGHFNNTNPGAYDGITALIASGRNTGNWDGPGLITTQADAQPGGNTTLAIATAAQAKGLTAGETTLFGGQTVTNTDVLVMYTYNGDANLDGKVNADDYFQIDSHYGTQSDATQSFFNGDFNYDGVVNGDDYALIDQAFANQGTPFSSAPGLGGAGLSGVSPVPEPASIAGIALLSAIGLRRRRRCECRVL